MTPDFGPGAACLGPVVWARILGIFFAVVALGALINRDEYLKAAKIIGENPAIRVVAGVFTLFIGLLVLWGQRLPGADWTALVFLAGLIMTLKGAAFVLFPGLVGALSRSYATGWPILTAQLVLMLCFGLLLAVLGWMMG